MIVFALLLAQAAHPVSAAYHLVVAFDRGGSVVIDYPSQSRCEKAKEAIAVDFAERLRRAQDNAMPNTIVTGSPFHFEAVCVPA